MHLEYITQGTCSKAIELDVNDADHTIESVSFMGGCPGNTVGVATMVRGQKAEDVIKRLEGIPCGMKRTSCPDQLAQALRQALSQMK